MRTIADEQDLPRQQDRQRLEAKFSGLVDRYLSLVYSAALRQVKDHHLAEDVAQQVFLRLAQNFHRLEREQALSAWLLVATHHAALDAIKARARRLRHESKAAAMARTTTNSGSSQAEWDQIAGHLDQAIASLSTNDRRAISLRYFDQHTTEEVARRLGISLDATHQRLHRATVRLREFFAAKCVIVSEATIGPMIMTHAIHAAPAGLAGAAASVMTSHAHGVVAGEAIAKGASVLMAISKTKAAMIGLAAILLIGGGAASIQYVRQRQSAANGAVGSNPIANNASGPEIAGYARMADGSPVAGAQVLISLPDYHLGIIEGLGTGEKDAFLVSGALEMSPNGTINFAHSSAGKAEDSWFKPATTNADGHFQFRAFKSPLGIVVRSEKGIGIATASEFETSHVVTVEPWARVEGDVRLGQTPMTNVDVTSEHLGDVKRMNQASVLIESSAKTDARGHFIMNKVAPGPATFYRWQMSRASAYLGRRGEIELSPFSPTSSATGWKLVSYTAGKTNHVQLGGMGRTLIGHLDQKLDGFQFRRATLSGDSKTEYWSDFTFDLNAGGSFKTLDILAGHYHLHIDLAKIAPGSLHGTSYHYLEYIAGADADFVVPPIPGGRSDEPFDLGELHLSYLPKLSVGQTVPNIIGQFADGRSMRLGDYRGQYVLLQLWTSSRRYLSREQDQLKAIFDRFGDDSRLRLLSVNLDVDQGQACNAAVSSGIYWPQAWVKDPAKNLPKEYDNQSSSMYLIDPQGRLLAENVDGFDLFGMLDRLLAKETP